SVPVDRVGAPLTPITITFCGALTGAKPPGVFEPVVRSSATLKEPQLDAQDSVEVGSDGLLSPSSQQQQQQPSESNENSTRQQEETAAVEAASASTVGETVLPQPLPTADEGSDHNNTNGDDETIPVILSNPSPPATIEN
ncbi:cyclophilin-type peptidyl-prolyl cis-trans isomerase, putative, partial [Bodo saltans]